MSDPWVPQKEEETKEEEEIKTKKDKIHTKEALNR